MKKLLHFLSLALILFACRKPNSPDVNPEEKKYEVTFTVGDFNQNVTTLGKSATKIAAEGDTLRNYVNNMYYRIYNSAGVLVNSIDQTSAASNFGTVSDRLPAGTYNVVIAASKGYLGVSSSGSSYSSASFSTSNWGDLYVKRISLTVGSSNISQAVRLDRVVGGLEINIQDAIPVNANKISVIYQNEAGAYYLSTGYLMYTTARTIEFPLGTIDKGKTNLKFFSYIGNVSTTSSVVIRAYDAGNGLISEKTVPNVRCYSNQKTVLTGTLFGSATSNSSSAFSVTVNPVWGITGTPVTF